MRRKRGAWGKTKITKLCGGSEEKKRKCIDKGIALAKAIKGQKG